MSRNHQNRARRVGHDLFRNVAQNHMVDTGAAMGRYHDYIDALRGRLLDDILVRRAELHDLTHLDQIDAIGKILGEESIQKPPAFFQYVTVQRDLGPAIRPLFADINSVIHDHLGADIARHLQGVADSDLRQIGEIRRRQYFSYLGIGTSYVVTILFTW